MKKFWSFLKWLFLGGSVLGLCCLIFAFVYVLSVTKDLPSVETLAEYKPAVMTRVHAGDGKLISEFRKEARVFVPVETIPDELQQAFVSAEDQRFYTHSGWDPIGLVRATLFGALDFAQGKRVGGTSTITQQVAKNFLVGDDYSIRRKIREIFIARRIEKAMDKDHILELYLNEIYFGRGAYGIAAASLNYFGKPMKDLSLHEIAYLAVLPKAPNNYQLTNPSKKERAFTRRNYVLGRMVEDGYVSESEANVAKKKDLQVVERFEGDEYLAAEYFVEEARKQIFQMYGEDELYEGGLSIRTTLDTDLQLKARRALRAGIEGYDRRYGYRGPLAKFESFNDWKNQLSEFEAPPDIEDWRVALVLEANKETAKLGFYVDEADKDTLSDKGTIKVEDLEWAGLASSEGKKGAPPKAVTDVITAGDVILAKPSPKKDGEYYLRQVPEVNGGIIAMDPHTGRILALVGGYSFAQSQFNRSTQAYRQPGSAFKPFVYAAAMDSDPERFTPASQVLDAPFVIERQDIECEKNEDGILELRETDEDGQLYDPDVKIGDEDSEADAEDECERFYKPSNYAEGKFYGLSTLRLGLEKSRNAMTVRLANDIGMAPVMEYGTRFGIYDEVKPELAWALGAGETTLMRLASAYSMLVNGGKQVSPTLLDRVQNGKGETIFTHKDAQCDICDVEEWDASLEVPDLPDDRQEVLDPVTAYQITFMLKGVVDNGTGRSIKSLGRPLAGKTGTTNDYLDAWFMGYSPDLVAGVYVGYDTPRPLNGEAGASAAAPIFKSFMGEALKGKAKVPFRIPEGVTLSPVNRNTGEPSYIGAPEFILEAFKPGTEPKLGELKSKIDFGSGSNSFFGSFDDNEFFEEDDESAKEGENLEETEGDDKTALNEKETASEDEDTTTEIDEEASSEVEKTASEVEEAAGDNELETEVNPQEAESVDTKVEPELSPEGDVNTEILPDLNRETEPLPVLEAEPEEEDLDDGLY